MLRTHAFITPLASIVLMAISVFVQRDLMVTDAKIVSLNLNFMRHSELYYFAEQTFCRWQHRLSSIAFDCMTYCL